MHTVKVAFRAGAPLGILSRCQDAALSIPRMTEPQDLSQWRHALREAVQAVDALPQEAGATLGDDAAHDLLALRSCATQISSLLGQDRNDWHEVRNLAGAMRGYAEMLTELGIAGNDSLGGALNTVLSGTSPPANLDAEPSLAAAPEAVTADPGFILAVDDRSENRELLARYLTRSGHFVVTAADGQQALETLAKTDVDVVLLDRRMPGMDGREVLAKIKADERWRATPVIMISGEQDMQGIVDCIEAGADDYLFKPFNPVLLQARIKAGIERKRWHDREDEYRGQLERNERFIRATFGRYLSDEIVTEILERPEGLELGGDLREVTIMMSDIRGFTTLSEQLPPARVVTMLNRYLGAMTEIIFQHRGTIDEFLGDAILAVFGAPQKHDDDPQLAANCALAMQRAMAEINRANVRDGLPELTMGIALNTGKVIAGNIGSERRSKYGFVGHAMNVTSRIEDICDAGEILIAESTCRSLGSAFEVGQRRELQAPGIDELLGVFPLLGPAS